MASNRYDRVRGMLVNRSAKRYRFEQWTSAVFSRGITDPSDVTTLPSDLRHAIAAELDGSFPSLQLDRTDVDGQATKYRFRLEDRLAIETVNLRYKRGWTSLCISSQAGCALGCTFCATATLGLKRQLTADEITDQVLWTQLHVRRPESIAFMGMGEPLANPAVVDAIDVLTDPQLFGFSPRRITVSTVGITHRLADLLDHNPKINMTFSLHAADPSIRRQLVPFEDRYPTAEILPILDDYIIRTRRQVTLACTLIDGLNDTEAAGQDLIRLLAARGRTRRNYHVNLYALNTSPLVSAAWRPSPPARVRAFADQLRRHGISVSWRAQFGKDVQAGCGQLAASASTS